MLLLTEEPSTSLPWNSRQVQEKLKKHIHREVCKMSCLLSSSFLLISPEGSSNTFRMVSNIL